MIIFIIHRKGKLNGAKKISLEVVDLAKKRNLKFKMSPYPHDFRYYRLGRYIIEYLRFVVFHLLHFSKATKIYFTGSNNTLGFSKDIPLILVLNLLYRKHEKIVHFHSSTIKLSENLHHTFAWLYQSWTHIYLGQNLVPITPPKKFHIISNYADLSLKKREDKKRKNVNIGYYGNIVEFKGIYDYNKIAANYDENDSVAFYSAGIGDCGLVYDQIHHYGELLNIEEKERYLNSIDILVYPSFWDAQPLSILEAFHCNTVVIAYDVGTISELLVENNDVLPMGDIDGIIRRIDYYIKDLKTLDKVKYKNYQQIMYKFNKENFIRSVESFIFK